MIFEFFKTLIADQVKALYDYQQKTSDELTFDAGDVITVIERRNDWSLGELRGKTGQFPSNYVQPSGTVYLKYHIDYVNKLQ